jgi:hypothetical protein
MAAPALAELLATSEDRVANVLLSTVPAPLLRRALLHPFRFCEEFDEKASLFVSLGALMDVLVLGEFSPFCFLSSLLPRFSSLSVQEVVPEPC